MKATLYADPPSLCATLSPCRVGDCQARHASVRCGAERYFPRLIFRIRCFFSRISGEGRLSTQSG
jgi:hypothetical protein